MNRRTRTALEVVTILPGLWRFGKWVAARIRARRAARRRGERPGLDAENVRKAYRDGKEIYEDARGVARSHKRGR